MLFFCAALVGCNSSGPKEAVGGPKLSQMPVPPASSPQMTTARAVAESNLDPKRKHEPIKSSTCVAVAAVKDELAKNPELSFAESEMVRAQARVNYQQAIGIDPKNVEAYVGLAKSYAEVDDLGQCCAMYDKALEVKPKDPGLWYEKGMTQARLKDFDGAVASLTEAQKIDPDNRLYGRMIGLALARSGKFDEAEKVLRTCMKPEEMHYNLARMHQHLKRPDACREQCQLALRDRPTYAPARDLLRELDHPSAVQQAEYKEPSANPVRVDGIE